MKQKIAKRERAAGRAEGKAEGKAEGIAEVAKNMLKFGESLGKVVALTGLTLEQVQNIQRSLQSPA